MKPWLVIAICPNKVKSVISSSSERRRFTVCHILAEGELESRDFAADCRAFGDNMQDVPELEDDYTEETITHNGTCSKYAQAN